MLNWVIISFLFVLGIKYYTASESQRLTKRIDKARAEIQKARDRLQEAQKRQEEVKAEEEQYIERVARMKDIIEDLYLRLTTADEAEIKVVSESHHDPLVIR